MDYSQITDTLYIGTTPPAEGYALLHELGVRLVIDMRAERWPYRRPPRPPIRLLWLPTFDNPLLPIPLRALLRGARAALQTFEQGGKVYVHCAVGAHRGVAMGAAILIAQGRSAEEAMQLISERRKAADPDAWYIRRRILLFAEHWKKLAAGVQELPGG